MSLRIAFDLDGVLADLGSVYDEVAKRVRETDEGGNDRQDAEGVDPRSASDSGEEGEFAGEALASGEAAGVDKLVWREIRATPDFWMTLEPFEPDAIRRMAELSGRYQWEVFFLTQRPQTAGETVQRQTQRWLESQGFDLPSVIVSGSRGKLADALGLDVLVDDTVQHCVDVRSESRARPILVRRQEDPVIEKNATRLGIEIVRTVMQCLDDLEEVSTRRERPAFLRRMAQKAGYSR